MADFTKKVEKERERLLQPGEQVLGATMIQPKGAFKKQAIAGGVGGAVGALVAHKMTEKSGNGATGLASGMPAKRLVAIVTDQRVLVVAMGSMLNSLKDVAASWPRTHVAGIDLVDEGKLVNVLDFRFADGTSVLVESVRAGNPRSVVEAFSRLVPQPIG